MKYGLSDEQLKQVLDIIASHDEIEEAVLFGSRAIDTWKEASDVDIALKGPNVTASLAAKLKFDLEEDTYLPFFFDFAAYPTITNEALKGHIDTKGVVIFRRGWRECKLGEVAEIQTGPFGSQLHASDYTSIGIPSIMPTNIGNRLEINRNNIECIRKIDAERLNRYLVEEGDIVYSRRGDVEKCAFITNKQSGWLCGTGCLRVRLSYDKVDPKFCAYYLSTDEIKGWVSGNAVGTTMPNLNSSILKRLPLSIPPLPEQKAIASVLSSLDDKIDLLHRQNKTLEAMAETLFRQWFVEEVQDDWEECTIANLIEFNPQRKLRKGSIAPYLEMASLSTSTFSPDGWYDREFNSGTKFVNGDTLLARITPCLENGKTAYITFLLDGQVAWGSTEYIVMRPKDDLHPFFAYTLARNCDFREYAVGCMEGTSGRQRVNVDHLKDYNFKKPSSDVITRFNSVAESVAQKLHQNSQQIRTLEKLRDNLLPKLMTGEVRVEYEN